MNDEDRFGRLAGDKVGLPTVVVDAKLRETGEEPDQVPAARIVSLADLLLGDVVPTVLNPRTDAGDVQVDTRQANVPDPHLESLINCLLQQASQSISAQRCLEGEVEALRDGLL